VLKIIPKDSIIDKEQFVINEKKTLTALKSNPFVVDLMGTFQDRENVYFIMEYIPGGELATVFNKNRISMKNEGKLMESISKQIVL
jgi:protein kinase A